jgi:hypothetical protein
LPGVLQWSRHFTSLIAETRRRVVQAPAPKPPDPLEVFQRHRTAHHDDEPDDDDGAA